MTTLRDAVMIGQTEERGYVIFHVSGRLDRNIYPEERGEEGPLERLHRRLSEIGDRPYALDVTECRFVGSPSIAIFTEAYRQRSKRVPVITTDEHLKKLLRDTKIDQLIEFYESADDLPVISSQ